MDIEKERILKNIIPNLELILVEEGDSREQDEIKKEGPSVLGHTLTLMDQGANLVY